MKINLRLSYLYSRCKELEQLQCNMTALKSVGTQAVITEFLINYADLLFGDNFVTALVGRRNGSGEFHLKSRASVTLACVHVDLVT
jgi:hypothetical protein